MKKINLKKVNHNYKRGDKCGDITPNVKESCLFIEDGEIIGFYIRQIPESMAKFINLANYELLSDRVPKSVMQRMKVDLSNQNSEKRVYKDVVNQYSTILGGIPPKEMNKRYYATISSVHRKESAQNFIKAMIKSCIEGENLIKEYMPKQYNLQKELIQNNVIKKYQFGNLFTSSISNFNISADFHMDTKNIKNSVNIIINKKENANGGNLYIPDYDACIDCIDNSLTVYPAWKSLHGVTPIIPTKENGYRNSLVFYALTGLNK